MDQDNNPETLVNNSSSLSGYTYDKEAKTLTVYYKAGNVYRFDKIEGPLVSQVFDCPGSIGSRLSRMIAKRYRAVRL